MAHHPSSQNEHAGGFWTISSFRVQVYGDVAIASDPFKVPTEKVGDAESGGEARRERSGGEALALAPLLFPLAFPRSLFHILADVAADKPSSGTTRVLEHDDQPYPWEMATAVSDKVFEDGVHEFLVEVGGTGLLGFCPASFVDQRTRIGKRLSCVSRVLP